MAKYHMNRREKEITDKQAILDILNHGRFATIALCRDNEPYIITMNYGFDRENNALYFHCALKGLKLQFIARNPRVCATIIEDKGYKMNECSHAYRSVVMWGNLEKIEDSDEKRWGLKILFEHLENNPREMENKILADDRVYDTVRILKLTIIDVTGKEGN